MNPVEEAWVRWYAVRVQIEHHTPDGWSGSRQVPLFYLDAHVQGFVSAQHATRVARDIVCGAGLFDTERVTVHITAQPADHTPRWAHPAGQSRVLTASQASALAGRWLDPTGGWNRRWRKPVEPDLRIQVTHIDRSQLSRE